MFVKITVFKELNLKMGIKIAESVQKYELGLITLLVIKLRFLLKYYGLEPKKYGFDSYVTLQKLIYWFYRRIYQ